MNVGAVVLAAGLSTRFGANKLLADAGGRPLIGCALGSLCAAEGIARRAAVVSDERVAQIVRGYGMQVIVNGDPARGQAHSIALAAQAMRDMDALLLMAGDQPLVRPETLTRLLRAFEAGGRGMACLMDGTHRGNPAVFRQAYFGQLAALTGDRGAGALLCGNEADLLVVHIGKPADRRRSASAVRQPVFDGEKEVLCKPVRTDGDVLVNLAA